MSTTRERIWRCARKPLLAWSALCLLLAVTVALAYVPLGSTNLVISLTIALAKTALIALVFMELASANGLLRLAAVTGCLWLFFLFFLTFSDYLSR